MCFKLYLDNRFDNSLFILNQVKKFDIFKTIYSVYCRLSLGACIYIFIHLKCSFILHSYFVGIIYIKLEIELTNWIFIKSITEIINQSIKLFISLYIQYILSWYT